MSVFDNLNGDSYKPPVLKESLAQWDNYQNHSLYCVDINYIKTKDGVSTNETGVFTSFLAVQAYSTESIAFNFDELVQAYP